MSKTMKTASKAPTPYFALTRGHDEENDTEYADVYIFGDIASRQGGLAGLLQNPSDQSSYDLATALSGLPEDAPVTVHINSNGGEVKEGLAIYNVLKSRANVTTICEGFAASSASLVFCAGSTRIMQPASLLFIHQAIMATQGNSDELEKAAEDLRTITEAAANVYREAGVNVSDEVLTQMLKDETWILPGDAVRMGFATQVSEAEEEDDSPRNDSMRSIMALVSAPKAEAVGEVTATVSVDTEGLEELKGVVADITAQLDGCGEIMGLAKMALGAFEKDPELSAKVKTFVTNFLTTNSTPAPAKVENKGFFNFKKPETPAKEEK